MTPPTTEHWVERIMIVNGQRVPVMIRCFWVEMTPYMPDEPILVEESSK